MKTDQKFEYHIERQAILTSLFGGTFKSDYQETIHQYAREGWRFVQAYAPATSGYGRSKCVDLIFERTDTRSGDGDEEN